eukprot:m.186774 g.186774  ORF g.186774 m.186774 type:complete len:52 (+) comp32279_c1_seq1:2384-2539(+)
MGGEVSPFDESTSILRLCGDKCVSKHTLNRWFKVKEDAKKENFSVSLLGFA